MAWGGSGTVKLRNEMIAEYGTICHLCGNDIKDKITVDHVIPRSKGGTDDLGNLRPAHEYCNYSRQDMSVEEYRNLNLNEVSWFLGLEP